MESVGADLRAALQDAWFVYKDNVPAGHVTRALERAINEFYSQFEAAGTSLYFVRHIIQNLLDMTMERFRDNSHSDAALDIWYGFWLHILFLPITTHYGTTKYKLATVLASHLKAYIGDEADDEAQFLGKFSRLLVARLDLHLASLGITRH